MTIAHKIVIYFGIVDISINMYRATQDNDIHINH